MNKEKRKMNERKMLIEEIMKKQKQEGVKKNE